MRDLDTFIAERTHELSLRDGTRLRLRPVRPEDKAALRAGFQRLSSRARHLRFLSPLTELSDGGVRYLTEIDYHRHFAWAAFSLDGPREFGVGVARYISDPNRPDTAEPAVTIIDEFQGRGLGTLLLNLLIRTAVEHGITEFQASLLEDNQAMRQVFQRLGARFTRAPAGTLCAAFKLPEYDHARGQLVHDLLRHARMASPQQARNALAGSEDALRPPDPDT